jgi:TonB family protein
MRLLIIAFWFTLIMGATELKAQPTEKKFYSKKGELLADGPGCYYYTVAKKPEFRASTDTLISIYCQSEKLRSIEIINKDGMRDGITKEYDEQGNHIMTGLYKMAVPERIEQFYPNGKPHSVEFYGKEDNRIQHYWDSVGNQTIKDGRGYCNCYLSKYYDGSTHLQTGKVVNGKPDSTWTGFKKNGFLYFIENYNLGSLISGISYDTLGNAYPYSVVREPPEGVTTFYQHVAEKMRYPVSARRKGIQGKVFIEFVVEKDGSLSTVRVVKGIGGGCDEEATRHVSTAPKWKPGLLRGQIVRQRYVVPIIFKLG